MAKYFNVGDKAITNGVNICGHGFSKGTVVTVKKAVNGDVDYVEDNKGNGYWVENEELNTFIERPYGRRFSIGDVVYLKHVNSFVDITSEEALRSAEATSDNGIRIATEDERRAHLGLPPVKKDTDIIEVTFKVTRKDLQEAVAHLGKHNRGYNTYSALDNALKGDN